MKAYKIVSPIFRNAPQQANVNRTIPACVLANNVQRLGTMTQAAQHNKSGIRPAIGQMPSILAGLAISTSLQKLAPANDQSGGFAKALRPVARQHPDRCVLPDRAPAELEGAQRSDAIQLHLLTVPGSGQPPSTVVNSRSPL